MSVPPQQRPEPHPNQENIPPTFEDQITELEDAEIEENISPTFEDQIAALEEAEIEAAEIRYPEIHTAVRRFPAQEIFDANVVLWTFQDVLETYDRLTYYPIELIYLVARVFRVCVASLLLHPTLLFIAYFFDSPRWLPTGERRNKLITNCSFLAFLTMCILAMDLGGSKTKLVKITDNFTYNVLELQRSLHSDGWTTYYSAPSRPSKTQTKQSTTTSPTTPNDEVNQLKIQSQQLTQGMEQLVKNLGTKLLNHIDKSMEEVWRAINKMELKNEDLAQLYQNKTTIMSKEMTNLKNKLDGLEKVLNDPKIKNYVAPNEQESVKWKAFFQAAIGHLSLKDKPSSFIDLITRTMNSAVEDKMHEIVDSAINKYHNDVIDIPDYALASRGARVIHKLTSGSHMTSNVWAEYVRYFTGRPLLDPNFKENAISPQSDLGECWKMKGNNGSLGIFLADRILINAVSLEFPAQEMILDMSTAPKDVALYGIKNLDGVKGDFIWLGGFQYDIEKGGIQTFAVESKEDFRMVGFEFLSNWGSETRTDIYRVRLHGTPAHVEV